MGKICQLVNVSILKIFSGILGFSLYHMLYNLINLPGWIREMGSKIKKNKNSTVSIRVTRHQDGVKKWFAIGKE